MKKAYLMLGGTFLPAMAVYLAANVLIKDDVNKSDLKNIGIAIALVIGGFVTANYLKDYNE